MLTTSPYSQNDYTSVQLRKQYQLPTQEIANTVMAMNQYWQQGASRIKAAEQQALGLNLTLDTNKEYSKKFLDETKKKINSMVGMDLGDTDVQKQALGLFKPLFENKSILLDDTISKQRNSIIAEAQSYKNKDKGVGYAEENIIDALDKFSDFNGKTDPNNLEAIYEKTKNARYIPYYDVTKEMITLRDKCGEVSGTSLNALQDGEGSYDLTVTGTPSSKIKDCLSQLSSQAITQLGISGRVRYGKNYQGLGKDMLAMNNNLQSQYATQLNTIEGILTSKKIGKGTSQERDASKAEIDAFTDMKTQLSSNISKIKVQNAKLEANDFSEVQKNYDDYAGTVYKNNAIDTFANSYYTEEREPELNMLFKMAKADEYARGLIDYRVRAEAAAKKKESDESGANFGKGSPTFGGDQGKETTRSYDQIKSYVDTLSKENYKDLRTVFADLKNIGGDSSKLQEIQTTIDKALKDGVVSDEEANSIYSFLGGFINGAEKDKNQGAINIIMEPYNRLSERVNEIAVNRDLLKLADDYAKLNTGDTILGSVVTGKFKFSNNSINALLDGRHQDYKLEAYETTQYSSQGTAGVRVKPIEYKEINYRLKDKNGNILLPNVTSDIKKYQEKKEELRSKFLSENVGSQYNIWNTNDTEQGKNLKRTIGTAAGLSFSNQESIDKQVNLYPSFGDGTVRFKFTAEKPEDLVRITDEFEKRAKEMYGSMWNTIDKESGIYEIKGVPGFDLLSQFGDLGSIRQRISIAEQKGESALLRHQIGVEGKKIEMKYDPSSDKIYIFNNNQYNNSYSSAQLTDAIDFFNSLTRQGYIKYKDR